MIRPAAAHRPAARRGGGFTLLEVAVAMAITIVLGAIALPSLSGLVARQRLKSVTHGLQADIALARQEAGRTGLAMHLMFYPGPKWCYVLSAGIAVDCRQAQPAPGNGILKVVRSADHAGTTLVEASAMAIDPRSGTSLLAAGHARFASPQAGQQLQVQLGRLGRASVCAPAAPVPGTPACPSPPPAS